MAFQFIQIPGHLESTASPPTYATNWKATGTTSQSFVHSYALGATPGIVSTLYGTLYRQDIRVRQVHYNQFTVHVPYGARKNETGEWTWDYDTTGGTIHITNSKETIDKYPTTSPAAVGDAPDQKGAIGVDKDQVKGTDIVIPAMKINVHFKHPLGIVTIAHAKFLAGITGMVNSDTFLTFSPGEVLFLGSRGADGSVAEATATYQFAMSANKTGMTIGDIAGVAKKGWEVAWISYKDATADVAGTDKPVRIPEFVYVERVYDTIAMATALGFGG